MSSECGICQHIYDEKKHKPLVLPCCHSFCRVCLEKLEEKKDKSCPVCRTSWESKSVQMLQLCYQLIPETAPTISKVSLDMCEEHNTKASLWCNSCDVPVCIKCVKQQHKDCDWLLIIDKYDMLQVEFKKIISEIRVNAIKYDFATIEFNKFIAAMQKFIEEVQSLHETMNLHCETVNGLVTKMKKKENDLSSFITHSLDGNSVEIFKQQYDTANLILKTKFPSAPKSLLANIIVAYQVIYLLVCVIL